MDKDAIFGWKVDLDSMTPPEPDGRTAPLIDESSYRRVVLNATSAVTTALDRVVGSIDVSAIRQIIDLTDLIRHQLDAFDRADPFMELAVGVLDQYIHALIRWRRVGLAILDGLEQLYGSNALFVLANLSPMPRRSVDQWAQQTVTVTRQLDELDRSGLAQEWIVVDPFEEEQFYTIVLQEDSNNGDRPYDGSTAG